MLPTRIEHDEMNEDWTDCAAIWASVLPPLDTKADLRCEHLHRATLEPLGVEEHRRQAREREAFRRGEFLEPIGVIEARRERARELEAYRTGEWLESIGVVDERRRDARTREMHRTGELLPPIDAPPNWDPFYVPPQMRQLTPPGAGLLYEAPAPPTTGMRSPDRGRYF